MPCFSELKTICHKCSIDGRMSQADFIRSYYRPKQFPEQICIAQNVVCIKDNAFRGWKTLRYVMIPDNVTIIGENAFRGCEKLNTVVLSNEIREIKAGIFYGCKDLKEISIPKGVTTIGENAFLGCAKLKRVTIPDGVREIGCGAFSECADLEEVVIPDSVIRIGWGAFSGCIKLSSIRIGKNVKEIGYGAFFGCKALAKIEIPKEITSIGSFAFSGCIKFKQIFNNPPNTNAAQQDSAQQNNASVSIYNEKGCVAEVHFDDIKTQQSLSKILLSSKDENDIVDEFKSLMNKKTYNWNEKDEFYTILEFNRYSNWLKHAFVCKDTPSQIACITSILKWGGVDQNLSTRVPDFCRGLNNIANGNMQSFDNLLREGAKQTKEIHRNGADTVLKNKDYRISSWSKILAAYKPGELFIYDSRVAKTLSIICRSLLSTFNWTIPDSRDEKIVDGQPIPNCYQTYHELLGILADKKSIIDQYNEIDQTIQDAYYSIGFTKKQAIMSHIEKMLFMEGD